MVTKALEERFGLPPLKEALALLSGEKGKQIATLLSRLENLSRDTTTIVQVIELLRVIEELDRKGTLQRLNELLRNLPKGKSGQVLVSELKGLLAQVGPQLERIQNMLQALLKEE